MSSYADLPDGPPMDVSRLLEDDLLLDRLGRGEDPAGHGEAVDTLSQWRAAMPEPATPEEPLLAAALSTVRRSRRGTRRARGPLVVATAAVLACGGVTAAAQGASPDSPLWPVTELVFPDLAASRVLADATHAVGQARAAVGDGRYESAAWLLDQAWSLAERVDEPGEGDRLRTDITAMRADIAARRITVDPGGHLEADPGMRPTTPTVVPSATPQPPAATPTASREPGVHNPVGAVPTRTSAAETTLPGGLPPVSAPQTIQPPNDVAPASAAPGH